MPPPPPVQLYDLTRDPHETTNLADSQPQTVHEMQRLLAVLRAPGADREASPPLDQMDPALRERLRSLGYVQ